MALNYQKTNWVNNETKLNADNMNNIEDGIKNASDKIDNLGITGISDSAGTSSTIAMSQKGVADAIAEAITTALNTEV